MQVKFSLTISHLLSGRLLGLPLQRGLVLAGGLRSFGPRLRLQQRPFLRRQLRLLLAHLYPTL